MVKRIQVVLTEEEFKEVKRVKNKLGLPWDKFIKLAARVLDKLSEEELKKYVEAV